MTVLISDEEARNFSLAVHGHYQKAFNKMTSRIGQYLTDQQLKEFNDELKKCFDDFRNDIKNPPKLVQF